MGSGGLRSLKVSLSCDRTHRVGRRSKIQLPVHARPLTTEIFAAASLSMALTSHALQSHNTAGPLSRLAGPPSRVSYDAVTLCADLVLTLGMSRNTRAVRALLRSFANRITRKTVDGFAKILGWFGHRSGYPGSTAVPTTNKVGLATLGQSKNVICGAINLKAIGPQGQIQQALFSYRGRRFSVAGPRIWTGLPHELRQCNTLPCFKSHLKTYYFRHHMDLASHSQVAPPIAFL